MSKPVGYIVLCDGAPMARGALSTLRKHEVKQLFHSRFVDLFRTYGAARRAARASAKAWNELQRRWTVMPVKVRDA